MKNGNALQGLLGNTNVRNHLHYGSHSDSQRLGMPYFCGSFVTIERVYYNYKSIRTDMPIADYPHHAGCSQEVKGS